MANQSISLTVRTILIRLWSRLSRCPLIPSYTLSDVSRAYSGSDSCCLVVVFLLASHLSPAIHGGWYRTAGREQDITTFSAAAVAAAAEMLPVVAVYCLGCQAYHGGSSSSCRLATINNIVYSCVAWDLGDETIDGVHNALFRMNYGFCSVPNAKSN